MLQEAIRYPLAELSIRYILISAVLWALCALSISATAQNSTNLPTSMYGVGELSAGDGGRYAGMGNVGIAINRNGFQNTLNPAAITRMDSTCFVFDVGAAASYSKYAFQNERSSSTLGNPNRISMGFRVMPRWYAIVGASPYSSVGYIIKTEEPIEGMPDSHTNSLFEGQGGLYRCYLTNAFVLSKRLSVGVNVGMVTGSITQSETQEGAVVKYESSKRAFYADLGLYYEFAPSTRQQWAVGLVFAPSMPISHGNNLLYSNSASGEGVDKSYRSRKQYLPMHIAAGVSATTSRWLLTADYNYTDWSRNTSSSTAMQYNNQHKLNLAGVYITNPRLPRSVELMGGVGFGSSYIKLRGGTMNYIDANVGVSFPIRYSYLSLGATWRKQINKSNSLMQENRLSLNLNLTFGERLAKFKLK